MINYFFSRDNKITCGYWLGRCLVPIIINAFDCLYTNTPTFASVFLFKFVGYRAVTINNHQVTRGIHGHIKRIKRILCLNYVLFSSQERGYTRTGTSQYIC